MWGQEFQICSCFDPPFPDYVTWRVHVVLYGLNKHGAERHFGG